MVLHVIAFMISASVLAVVGVLFLALLLVKLNNTQQQAREAYLKELVYDREQTMAVVAREVHDHMKQMLYMARRNLKTVEAQAVGPKRAILVQTGRILDQLLLDAMDISSTLDPDAVMQSGLEKAFMRMADWLNCSGNPTCRLRFHYPGESLSPESELSIFRVAQEAVQNVVRHAKASQVDLEFSCTSKEVFHLIVRDDGEGSPEIGLGAVRMRMGLRNMQQRAEILGAQLRIDSKPGGGTIVQLKRTAC